MTGNLDFEKAAILTLMRHDILNVFIKMLQVFQQLRNGLRRPDVGGVHRQKFFTGEAITPDGCGIYVEEGKGLAVTHPHGHRIIVEQHTIPVFRLIHGMGQVRHGEIGLKIASKYSHRWVLMQ